ncbi:MAG: YicC family protein [candidate division Zixibacteria bacterium]|nr:YicC family protein [candidate division Zixibacteria bacterium]
MISSMTGYGRAEKVTPEVKITVEISSVNNRFSDVQARLPKFLYPLEPKLKELILKDISRGKIYYSLNWEDLAQTSYQVKVNMETAKMYKQIFTDLKKELKLKGELELEDFINLPDLTKAVREEIDLEETWTLMEEATKKALAELNRMRQAEGKNLADELKGRMQDFTAKLGEIEKLSQESLKQYQEKLKAKIAQTLGGVEVDQTRIAQEVAMMADKIDISEECTRFKSHQEQFLKSLNGNGSVGKRLGFILQELNREANTIGSKSVEYGVSERVIFLKEELEKMREQVQNIE